MGGPVATYQLGPWERSTCLSASSQPWKGGWETPFPRGGSRLCCKLNYVT